MKTLDEYMKLHYPMEIVEDEDEGGYVLSFPDLPGCLTIGETIKEAIDNSEDAKRQWLKSAIEEGIEIALPKSNDDYSGQFKLRIPKSLHRSLALNSKKEGISMNQYCLYLLSKNNAEYMMNK